MMAAATAAIEGWDALERKLKVLVPGKDKPKVYIGLARKALSLNRQRIRRQEMLSGGKFPPRSDGGSRKQLVKILRQSRRKQVRLETDVQGVSLLATNPVAAMHHYGAKGQVKISRDVMVKTLNIKHQVYLERRKLGEPDTFRQMISKGEPSKAQLKALKHEVGFRKSYRWLKEKFTMGTAGYIIRKHRVRHPDRVAAGDGRFEIPPRHVLGLGQGDVPKLMQEFRKLIARYAYFKDPRVMAPGNYAAWKTQFEAGAA